MEEIAEKIDKLDNLAHALLIPMPADFHVSTLKEMLPELVQEFKESFVAAGGENYWID